MRHNVKGRKLNRTASHRKMMFRNMVTDLFRHGRIRTTTVKAKEARSLAERLITYAKAGDLNSRRQAARRLTDPDVLKVLFDEIGPRYADRAGGYTRILKIDGVRKGDCAEMAILELVGQTDSREKTKGRSAGSKRVTENPVAADAAAAPVEELAAPQEEPEAEAETEPAAEAEAGEAEEGQAAEADDEEDK